MPSVLGNLLALDMPFEQVACCASVPWVGKARIPWEVPT